MEKACTVCGKVIDEPIGNPNNHVWGEPAYTWSNDNKTVTAERVCKNNKGHKETEKATTTSKVTKAATYTSKGQTTYTSSFKNKAFKTQVKIVSNIPMIPKKANTMTVKTKAKNVKAKKLKKKALTVKTLSIKKAKGKVTYKLVGGKAKSKKALKFNAKNGKVTVKKKTKKGIYKLKVKVTAAGNTEYKTVSKIIRITVKVK